MLDSTFAPAAGPAYAPESDFKSLEMALESQGTANPDIWLAYVALAKEPNRQKTFRNELIAARMYAIDIEYTKYEAKLTHENQEIEFGTTAVNLGLTTAATIVTPALTKSILSGTSSFITGSEAAYSQKILLSKTIQNVQTQMRANREEQAAVILANKECPITAYPLGEALSDLEGYYRAGTFTAGLIKLTSTVNQAESDAKEKKAATKAGSNASIESVIKIMDQLEGNIRALDTGPKCKREGNNQTGNTGRTKTATRPAPGTTDPQQQPPVGR